MTHSEEARREAYLASIGDPAHWRRRIYDALARCGEHGATCDELEEELGCQFTTAGAVIIGLRDSGWVDDAGFYRNTRRGHRAVVWVARREQNPNPPYFRRGRGKWEVACRECYDELLLGDLDGAMSLLEKVITER